MLAAIDTITTLIRAVLTPQRCRFCGSPLLDHHNPYLCHSCIAGLPWLGDNVCRKCGFPQGPYSPARKDCPKCRAGNMNVTAAAAVVRYRAGAKNLIKSFKFGGETRLASPIASLMAERLAQTGFSGKIDAVIPVPLHPLRRRQRGFDQALLLAEIIAETTSLPLITNVLFRTKPTPPQATLHRSERLNNIKGAFSTKSPLNNTRILLVDDVMTTGATISECAHTCLQSGSSATYALTFAR